MRSIATVPTLLKGYSSTQGASLATYTELCFVMLSLRQSATGTRLAQAQVNRLRSTVIKIAARVRVSTRRVLVELAAYVPFAPEHRRIARHLMLPQPWILRADCS